MRRKSRETRKPVATLRRRLLSFGVIVVAGLGMPTASAAEASREIVIAAVYSTGAAARADAAGIARAVRNALEARPGATGGTRQSIRVVALDDKCRADEAAIVAGQAVAVGATLVIGHSCGSAAVAAAQVYVRHAIPLIALGVRIKDLTIPPPGRGIFRLGPREDHLAADIVRQLGPPAAAGRIALVHDKSAYARGLGDDITRALSAQGRSLALREIYTAAEPEYDALVERLVTAGVDGVVLPAQPIEAGILARRLRERGSRAMIVGGEAVGAAPGFEPRTGKPSTDDMRFLMLPWPGNAAMAGGLPNLARIALDLWQAARAAAPSGETDAIVEALYRVRLQTGLGPIAFAATGDAMVQSFLPHTWQEGRWRPRVR
ncbi:MAG: ABC transporter substrate-binding protein [Hyphomicrobiaceae bacterium]